MHNDMHNGLHNKMRLRSLLSVAASTQKLPELKHLPNIKHHCFWLHLPQQNSLQTLACALLKQSRYTLAIIAGGVGCSYLNCRCQNVRTGFMLWHVAT